MMFLLKHEFDQSWRIILRKYKFTASKFNEFALTQRLYSNQGKVLPYNIIDANSEDSVFKLGSDSDILQYCKDSRIIYNCYIQKHKFKGPYYLKKQIESEILAERKKYAFRNSIPLVIEKLYNKQPSNESEYNEDNDVTQLHTSSELFPYAEFENFNLTDISNVSSSNSSGDELNPDIENKFSEKTQPSVAEDISVRLKAYNEKNERGEKFPQMVKHPEDDEEFHLRFYEDTLLNDLCQDNDEIEPYQYINQHGTPDPNIPKSSVPCGGCGAHLHCQDEGLPGYLPCEMFKGKNNVELRSLLCVRCFFLKTHKAALNVRVSPDVYEKALQPIAGTRSLIIAVVDLIDTPCSIWPGFYNLIGRKRPVVVVGNKVDLLPLDNHLYLKTIKTSFIESIKSTSLWNTAINHVSLVSAKTGYGIEDLISQIQTKWGIQGDIYIVGCTNAGKSTLFNALLRSDLCKVRASNLIQRATASPWPGTTLNLLKFPLFKPTGYRLASRRVRLRTEEKKREKEVDGPVLTTKYRRLASLTGHIGQTFRIIPNTVDASDPFKIAPHRIPKDSLPKRGINENAQEYAASKWCFDTPGTVQPDQFLGLLTHDELMDVLPKRMIVPKSFVISSSQSLFIAGLARLDLLYTPGFLRVSVCCSDNLPVTIVRTCEASSVYRSYLGTKLLHVPRGNQQRLERWSTLKPTNVHLLGKGRESAADIVLSSAGFVSIVGAEDAEIDLRCWTPGGRGVYLRSPSMLPQVSNLRGKRISRTPAYAGRVISSLYPSS